MPGDRIKHIYIPDIYGKEKRKKEPSKEGKLGVEGMSEKLLLDLFNKANVSSENVLLENPVTNYDLFDMGFSGTPNAKANKKKLLKALDLPEFLSTNSLLSYINSAMSRGEFEELVSRL